MKKEELLNNIEKIHSPKLGIDRIKKNIKLENDDVISFCKSKIIENDCNIYKKGKNWYCEIDNIIITINSNSYTIITANKSKI